MKNCYRTSLLVALITASTSICSSVHADSFLPTLDEWKNSAKFAATDAATWIPLAGALLIKATNSDQHISNWAADKRPLFGDTDVSDDLKNGLTVLAIGTEVFSPQASSTENWYIDKGSHLGAMFVATSAANGTTGFLKNKVKRKRPNDPNGDHSFSFPSGHATEAFAWAAVSRRNLEDYDLSSTSRVIWNVGIYTAASSVAWDRVELKAHYPTDVLVGAAVGNFIATTIYRAFVGEPSNKNLSVSVNPSSQGLMLNIDFFY